MKRLLPILVLLALVLASLSSCASSHEDLPKQTANEIPEQSITYTNFTFGNVIQDGKQAVFFNFASDYTVTKMEIAGTLLDKEGNVIHSFDESITFGTSSYNPEFPIRIDKELIKKVTNVSFTKMKAYTTQELNTSIARREYGQEAALTVASLFFGPRGRAHASASKYMYVLHEMNWAKFLIFWLPYDRILKTTYSEMPYRMKSTSSYEKARALLTKMSLDEKIYQLSAQMIFSMDRDYEQNRDHKQGNYRNPGHFMHYEREKPASAKEVAERINLDVRLTMDAHQNAIPPIEHGEALHGAQWGMATCFPQPIGMASTFDDELISRVADAIGKECIAVGVRQVLSPVVNITRDCRWGRTMEGFGEDVLLTSNMGVAMCRGLQSNGVIATPKHFADNYSHGGRDSNYSETSERTMREVYLKPFETCVKDGGAQSMMAAYNAWDGIPCSANHRLLTEILRDEWGFDGFVVSDYGGVDGVYAVHTFVDSEWRAEAACMKAGLEINLPQSSYEKIKRAYADGVITEEDIDRAVLRILKVKYDIGLMDTPFVDPDKADEIVRCAEHKRLALECAKSSMVLLKNSGNLPLCRADIKKLAVFGASAKDIPVGKNYSGPYGRDWETDDAKTPLQYLKEYLDGYAEVIFAEDENIADVASACDAAIYFTTQIEGEGMDRSDIRLPKNVKKRQEDENAIIVGKYEIEVTADQEESIRKMCSANHNSTVVLLGGSPIDMSAWIDGCAAVLEAWYPGEQGARAITEIVFGDVNPSGKLPITFPKNVGQLPLFYSAKPSGRGKGYIENDGSPLYPFGYGLSYTKFAFSNVGKSVNDEGINLSLTVENIGDYDGAEVLQVYVSGRNCDVVMPSKELKAYKRVFVSAGEVKTAELQLAREAFCYYDRNMKYGMHDGDYKVMIGTSCEDIAYTLEASVRSGRIHLND